MKCLAFVLAILLLQIGCSSSQPKLTQAQMNAIETREVDANLEATFNAASGALFDAGYTIFMSDRQGGLLTGTKSKDNAQQRMWVSPAIQDTHFTVSIQMRVTKPNLTTVRVKTAVNGESMTDKKVIDEIWVLMQRQVMMKEPLSTATQ